MKEEYIKCTKCNYEFYPSKYYMYCNEDGTIKYYPKISVGWCLNCNQFVNVQEGIEFQDVLDRYHKLKHEIENLNHKFFKFKSTKSKIKALQEQIAENELLLSLLDGHDSYAACTKCDSTNIIRKDLRHSFWAHNCLGHLTIVEEESDVLYRMGYKEIYPVIECDDIDWIEKISRCALDMIMNHNVFAFEQYKVAYMLDHSDMKYHLYVRTAFIYAFLSMEKEIDISSKEFSVQLYNYLGDDINEGTTLEVFQEIFMRCYDFFDKEIYYFKVGKYFVPSKIVYPMLHPTEISYSHDLHEQVVRLDESIWIWKIVLDTYRGYFRAEYE